MIDHERAKKMIESHKLKFGVEPEQIVFPCPTDFTFDGIKLVFHPLPDYYSVDNKNCLHHYFRDDK